MNEGANMERIRLWRYKKLANENVKEHKAIDQQERSKKEDYNSCFKLKKSKVRFNLYCITYYYTAIQQLLLFFLHFNY